MAAISLAAYSYFKITAAERELITKIETISHVHNLAVGTPLWTLDFEGLNRIMRTLALYPEILCVVVNEADLSEQYQWPIGCIATSSSANLLPSELKIDNQFVGELDLYYTNRIVRETLNRELLTVVLFSFLIVALTLFAAYLTLQHIVGRPIRRLNASILKAEQSNELETVSWSAQDELGNVISAYNRMINQIEENTSELVAATERAKTAAHAKSRFLANMSHELRTPLNAVIGISEMLREDAEDEQRDTEPYDRVAMSGRHLLNLIDDILDFSKIEAGKVSISIEEIDLAPLLEEVCATVRPQALDRSNELELSYCGTPVQVMSDPFRLRQILINLLSNACKFTKDGQVTLEVTESEASGTKGVLFSVSDTGIGISEEQRERLFSDFSQADNSTTRQYGGTGLGLAISQRLCGLLGGEISLESTPGEGSEFSFTLPAE